MNFYNCFQIRRTSLVSYYSISKHCCIKFIELSDLQKLAKSCLPLQDQINIAKLKIKSRMVDDIDFQLFPQKYLIEKFQ